MPPLPDLAEQAKVEALVGAFGSDAVRERMKAWRGVVLDMIRKDYVLRLDEAETKRGSGPSGVDNAELWRFIHEARPKEQETRELLTHEIAVELGHRSTEAGDRRTASSRATRAARPRDRPDDLVTPSQGAHRRGGKTARQSLGPGRQSGCVRSHWWGRHGGRPTPPTAPPRPGVGGWVPIG